MKQNSEITNQESAFSGGGEMGKYVREFDWSKTALGPLDKWPQSLKTAVNIILNSQHPMWIGWGPELIFLYNDAYIQVLGLAKHPDALGQSAEKVWAEIWDVCGPLAERVMQKAESIFVDNVRLFMKRVDYLEEVYYSFSYSPIRDEQGNVQGLFCPSASTTDKLLSERRLKTLGELSTKALVEKSIASACDSAMQTLAKNRDDIPFALLYLVNLEQQYLTLAQSTGLEREIPMISPAAISLEQLALSQAFWPITDVIKSAQAQQISVATLDKLPLGLEGQRITEALILPLILPGNDKPIGILITGVNPCRKLDTEYRTFYDLLAGQLVTAIQNAKTYEDEKQRIELLAELDKAKTVFFSNVSHEFRTPLTLMLSPLEDALADLEQPLPTKQRDRIELIQRNGLRLLKLVNSLLDFSRIEAKRIQAVYEPTDLPQLTSDLVSVFRSTMEKAKLELVVETPPLEEEVYVDKEMWEKIIFNLLSNAFKFTLKGRITVSLQKRADVVELKVQDTGVGIPETELPRLFERFHRVEGTQGRSYEGTGIGLALIQELVKLHSGHIQVKSQPGQGSIFTVTIPLGTSHLSTEKLSAKREAYQPGRLGSAYVQEAAHWLPKTPELLSASSESPSMTLASSLASSPSLLTNSKARILLADDNKDMREYVQSLLGQHWQVETVEDGEAALQRIFSQPPDLVLSDVMMPKVDGFGLLKALRQDQRTQTLPVILLSARAGEEAKIEGLQAGADDYLVKPFSAKELLARVESHLKITQLRKAAFQREQELLIATQTAQANLEQVLTNIKDSFIVFNRQWEFVYINQQGLEFLNKPKEEVLGRMYWDLFPDIKGTDWEKILREAMETGQMRIHEFFYPGHERWYENRVYTHAQGLSIFSTDITLRKRLERERQEAIELANQQQQQRLAAAEEFQRRQTEFVNTICHELRNPLNAIYGSVDILETILQNIEVAVQSNEIALNEMMKQSFIQPLGEMKDLVNTLSKCAQQQKVIVDDVLDLSKLESGKVSLNQLPFNPKQTIEHTVKMFENEYKRKKLSVYYNFPSDDFEVEGDPARLIQILTNLLSNAIKFTHQGGITIALASMRLTDELSELTVTVKDTGIGMTREQQENLFKPFMQANAQISAVYGGSGLGLVISKKLVELMSGHILVKSEEGIGSEFTFTIRCKPLVFKVTPNPEIRVDQSKVIADTISCTLKDILVVEDNFVNQRILVRFLQEIGQNAQVANNGIEAVEAAKTIAFDIIFMDVEMPNKNGLEATREIREYEALNFTHTPAVIIGLSGDASPEQIDKALKCGMNDYLTKPYLKQEIYEKIWQAELALQSGKPFNKNQSKEEASQVSKPIKYPGLNFLNTFSSTKAKTQGLADSELTERIKAPAKTLFAQAYPFIAAVKGTRIIVRLPLNPPLTAHLGGLILSELKHHLGTLTQVGLVKTIKVVSNDLLLETNTRTEALQVQGILKHAGLNYAFDQPNAMEQLAGTFEQYPDNLNITELKRAEKYTI